MSDSIILVDVLQDLRENEYEAPFRLLEISHVVSSNACVVEIAADIQGDIVYAKGVSRRAQGDASIIEVGYMVALSRALASLQRKVQRRADGLVRHMDDIAEAKRVAKKQRHQTSRNQAQITAVATQDKIVATV